MQIEEEKKRNGKADVERERAVLPKVPVFTVWSLTYTTQRIAY